MSSDLSKLNATNIVVIDLCVYFLNVVAALSAKNFSRRGMMIVATMKNSIINLEALCVNFTLEG